AGRGRGECLDRRDRGGAEAVDSGDTGTGGDAVHMYGAGAAERGAAAEFRAGHAEHVAQHPQERGVAVDIDRPIDAVELDRGGHSYLRAIRVDLTIRPLEPARTSSLENRALPAPQQASRRSYAAFVASAGV